MSKIHTVFILTISSIKMLVRNKQSLFFALFMPVVIMTIFGFIGFDQEPKISIGVVTSEPTEATRQFVDGLKDISAFDLHESASEENERKAIEKGERIVVLVVPDALMPISATPSAMLEKQTLRVLTNVSQPQQAQTSLSIINQILDKTTITLSGAPEFFELQAELVSAKDARYIDFILPGIVAMAVMQMSIFSVAFVFADYKEKGILKRLIATPMKPYQFVSANVIVRLFMALAQVAILIALGVFLLHSQVVGSLWLVALIAILGCIMFLGLGFVISGLAKTVEAVPAIANIVAFPMLFLSGVFFPLDSMPEWLQNIVQYLPLTYFADAMRDVMGNGATFLDVRTDLLWMLGWSVVLIIVSNITFSFEEKRV